MKVHRKIIETEDGDLILDFIPTPSGRFMIEVEAPSEEEARKLMDFFEAFAAKEGFDPNTGEYF